MAEHAVTAAGVPAAVLADARAAITDGALQTVRDLSHLLHPALLDDLGLTEAVDWYLKGFGKRHGVRARTAARSHGGTVSARGHRGVGRYRIVQEAPTNVAKHARATELPGLPA